MSSVNAGQINRMLANMDEEPKLGSSQWNFLMALGIIFILMVVLQLLSFSKFTDALEALGLGSASTWAVLLVIAELWAGIGFMKFRMPPAIRLGSALMAILVSGFWFLQSVAAVSTGKNIANMGFFGDYLRQAAGWWPVIETAMFLFAVLYGLSLLRDSMRAPSTAAKPAARRRR